MYDLTCENGTKTIAANSPLHATIIKRIDLFTCEAQLGHTILRRLDPGSCEAQLGHTILRRLGSWGSEINPPLQTLGSMQVAYTIYTALTARELDVPWLRFQWPALSEDPMSGKAERYGGRRQTCVLGRDWLSRPRKKMLILHLHYRPRIRRGVCSYCAWQCMYTWPARPYFSGLPVQ